MLLIINIVVIIINYPINDENNDVEIMMIH